MQSFDEMESSMISLTSYNFFSSFFFCINMKFDNYDSLLSIHLKKIQHDKILIKGLNIEQKINKFN